MVSLGPHTVVDIAQVLDFLANDTQTQSIIVYLEGITHARRFMSALRSAAIAKPVVVLKAGRKPAGNEAAQTHSGTIVGSDDVFDAALRRAGAVRVRSFVELFSAAKCLASRYRPVGQRLAHRDQRRRPGRARGRLGQRDLAAAGQAVGAPHRGAAAAVAARRVAGRPDRPVRRRRRRALRRGHRSGGRDDRTSTACWPSSRRRSAVDADAVARALAALHPAFGKPLLSCWMGDATVGDARGMLNDARIPSFRTPEAAVGAFGNIASFYQNQQLLQQTPTPLSTLANPDIEGARLVIESVLAERRKVLTEMESKTLLSSFHIPITNTIARAQRQRGDDDRHAARLSGGAEDRLARHRHKSDVQGVALNMMSGAGARDTYNDMMEHVARAAARARASMA